MQQHTVRVWDSVAIVTTEHETADTAIAVYRGLVNEMYRLGRNCFVTVLTDVLIETTSVVCGRVVIADGVALFKPHFTKVVESVVPYND